METTALELVGILLFVMVSYFTILYLGKKGRTLYKKRQLTKRLTISKFVRLSGGGYVQLFKFHRKMERVKNG